MTFWICIPVHNRVQLTLNCLESLARQDTSDFQVIVCDDGSTDGTTEAIKHRYPRTILLHGNGDLWWTGAINRCTTYVLAHASDNDSIVTLNNDLEVKPDYLRRLANASARHPEALVTSVVYDIRTGQLASSGFRQNWLTGTATTISPDADRMPEDPDVAWITHASGRGTLIPISVFHNIGMFDEKHLPHYGADYDFSYRAQRAGFDVYACFSAKVYSHVSETGITAIRSSSFWRGLYMYLTSRKSPANLSVRWWFAVKNCPRWLLPSFLLLDLIRTTGSYLRHRISAPAS